MFEVLRNLRVVTNDEKGDHAMLHAHLASWAMAVELNHMTKTASDALVAELSRRLVHLGFADSAGRPTGVVCSASAFWNEFGQTMATVGAQDCIDCGRVQKLADLRLTPDEYASVDVVSIAPMKYHLELIKTGAKALGLKLDHLRHAQLERLSRPNLAIAARCLEHALKDSLNTAGLFLKGTAEATAWLAPVRGEVLTLVKPESPNLIAQRDLNDLRDLLGLWNENGESKKPVAAFFIKARRGVYAPNVITAGGYQRFRHRPETAVLLAPQAGLTYNLNRTAAKMLPGSIEIVGTDLMLEEISEVRAGGTPKSFGFDDARRLASHQAYAGDVTDGRSFADTIHDLERLIH